MRRLARYLIYSLVALIGTAFIAIATFEITIVQPLLRTARASVAAATSAEKSPSESITKVLNRAYGKELPLIAASLLVRQSSIQGQGLSQLQRQFTEAALSALLPIHMSREELTTFFMAQTNMGSGVRGFSSASARYFGVPLERASLTEAATLVAISHAPAAYLSSPERLARRTQHLLAQGHE